MNLDQYYLFIFILVVLINLFSVLMFIGRVHRPQLSRLSGKITLVLGIPSLVMGIAGIIHKFCIWIWIMPLLYTLFSIACFFLDVVWKVEFRKPRQPKILVPFLILYYIPIIGMWGMLWNFGLLFWGIAGITYFAMLGSSFYALSKGVG